MTIETRDTVDLVAMKPDSNLVELHVTDHLDWSDPERHGGLLREKLNAYVEYVETGQLAELDDPRMQGPVRVTIAVTCRHDPPKEVDALFARLEAALQKLGFGFEVSVGMPSTLRRFAAPSRKFALRPA